MDRLIAKNYFFIFLIFFLPSITHAALKDWKIIPSESSLVFTGTQNNAPATGSFKKFTGEIQIDPDNLATGKIHIVIDMNSLTTTYADFTSTLISADWFNVTIFPQAVFDANQFKKIGENKYQANGTLKIRDKIAPATLTFTAETLSPTKRRVKGTATVKRIQFGVGQGDWADTEAVKDDVTVNFIVTAST